jgi:hypothetical protein
LRLTAITDFLLMPQSKTHWSHALQRWCQASLLSSATLMGALTVLSAGSAQAVSCSFDPTGFTTCSYGQQFPGGGPGDLGPAGPLPPSISAPFTDQWFDTQYDLSINYYPTDKRIKYLVPHQHSTGMAFWVWADVNNSGTWRIPPDPHSTDIWGSVFFFFAPPTMPDSTEYLVRITEPGYHFEDVGLFAELMGDASVKKDVYTVLNGGKGSLIGSLTVDSSNTENVWLPLHGYQELYIIDSLDPGSMGNIQSYVNLFRQEVPGPLPLLGAGTAFGFSRKLRRRLQASRLSPTA